MNRLLDQPIDHRGYSQHARTSSRFRNIHPPHSSWLVGSLEDLLFNLCPLLPQVTPQLRHFHAIDSGGTSVSLYSLQGFEHVASFEHSFDELWLSGIGLCLLPR